MHSGMRSGSGLKVPPLPVKRSVQRSDVLWRVVRRSIPTFVGRPARSRFRRQRAPVFMINPDTKYKRAWDILVTLCVVYTAIVVPYRVCFKRDASGGLAAFETSMDVAFFTDIILNFITGARLPNGDVTYESRVIVGSYLRGWFAIDFLSTVPFDNLFSLFGVTHTGQKAAYSTKLLRSLKVVRLVKLARIRKLNKMFSSLEDGVYTNQSLLSLIKLAFTMLFISHLVACLWFAVSRDHAAPSWVNTFYEESEGEDLSVEQYLASMYWAIITMATIGYGDIVARNALERLINVAVMAVGVSFFGYVVGTISSLVSNLDVAAALYDERMTIVKEYVISRNIPKPLSKRIRAHFEYFYQNHSVFKAKQILNRLPSALRNEMIHHAHSKLVANIKYFESSHESLISDIVMDMKPFSVLRNEFVYAQNEIAAHVFFLLKGKVNLTKASAMSHTDIRLATLGVGEHFGELEVYDHQHGNGVRICSAVARSFCELSFLSRQAISRISDRWPELLRHFKEAAAASSTRMRRRVQAVEEDEDWLFQNSEMEEAMRTSSQIVQKSARESIRPSFRQRLTRISPMGSNEPTQEGEAGADSGLKAVRSLYRLASRKSQELLPQISDDDDEDEEEDEDGDVGEAKAVEVAEEIAMDVEKEKQPPHETPSNDGPNVSTSKPLVRIDPGGMSPTGRGRIILESLPFDKVGKVTPIKDLSDSRTASAKAELHVVSDMEEGKPNTFNHASPMLTTLSSGKPDGRSALSRLSAAGRAVITDRAQDIASSTSLKSTPPSPTSTAKSPKVVRTTIQSMSRANSGSGMAAAARLASEQDQAKRASRRSLNDLVAKIRDAPIARPKPSFQSERAMLKGTYLFHPQQGFILTWQLIVGFAILYSIILVPYRLGFSSDAAGVWYLVELVIDGFFFADIIFNFRTAFFDEERLLVYDAKVITLKYLKGWFVIDLLSTLPIDEITAALFGSNNSLNVFPTKILRLFRVTRLLKLARLIKLSRVAGRLREYVQLSPSTERLIRLLLIMSIFCHWNACMFHGVILLSESSDFPSWCEEFFPADPARPDLETCSDRVSLYERYVVAMYWAFTTFTTVGYGDIRPNMYSAYELALVILLVVINATAFGYVISSVMTLIRNLDPSDREFRLRMTEMKDYLRDTGVSTRLGINIKVHYQHNILSTSLFPEKKLFNRMSPSLRFDIARLVAGDTLFAIPLITVMEDTFKGFVSYALFLMKPLCILRTEKVCRHGGPGTEMYFLVEGECDLVNSQTGEGRIVGENAVFEQYSLMAHADEIYRTVSTVTAVSKKCLLYSFGIEEFKILEEISPAVSKYFLSQLAAVLVEDDLFTLTSSQKANVESAIRNGRSFRSMAEQYNRRRLSSVSNVAMAKLNAKRRSSEWAPDILPRLLTKLEEEPKTQRRASDIAAHVVDLATNSQDTEHAIHS
ncbi:hypothetical protein Poli38472_003973 [Pythium oligandrum]|uniref:Cyclic nucleotide-binding domain-containing protein n=1 Tax=Pythium oligandrum TaxID=41045 RepID=A0A8K1FQ32_PYTOL|nr:hypothetical protein Poli38472_003973 [Pythium oligandrum]|eukprot:TMW66208.1 hypothetical protein Poli38472_003973 [Pythium oligandrum]